MQASSNMTADGSEQPISHRLIGIYLFCLIAAAFSVAPTKVRVRFFYQISGNALPGIRRIRGNVLFGLLPRSCYRGLASTLEMMHAAAAEQGIAYGWMGVNVLAVLRDPDLIRTTLSQPDEVLSRTGGHRLWAPFSTLQRLIGDCLFSYVGEKAKVGKNLLKAEFVHTASLQDKFGDIIKTANNHIENLKSEHAADGCTADLERTVEDFSTDLIGRSLFGMEGTHVGNDELLPVSDKIGLMCASPSHTWRHAVRSMLLLNTREYQDHEERKTAQEFEALVQQRLIGMDAKNTNQETKPTVIQRISLSTGGGTSKATLSQPAIEQARLSLFGGHHGMGLTLTWVLLELSKNPTIVAKLRAEIRSAKLSSDSFPDFQSVHKKMPYLDAILYETLRVYPTVHATVRALNKSYALTALDGTPVVLNRGTIIYVSIYLLHREKSIWGPDADKFRPERFLGEGDVAKSNGYMPFGYGGRSCAGYQYALLAAKTFLIMLLGEWDVVIENAIEVKPHLTALCEPDRRIKFGLRKFGSDDA
ncbi:Elongator complex protein 1 [Venturia nashicola]|nr:Elongator complex protein 1 [Venturia nashicola]